MKMRQIKAASAYYAEHLDGADAARLAFFGALWDALDAADAAGDGGEGYEAPAPARVKELSAAAVPVFAEAPVAVDAAALARGMEALCGAAVERGGFPEDVTAALARTKWDRVIAASDLDLAGKSPVDYLSDLADVLADDGMTEPQARLAALLASLALRAQLEGPAQKVAQARKKADVAFDHQCQCPACGSAPAVARVGEGGSGDGRGKTLWCPQCATVWEFDRIRCPRCGTHNQGHLHYFNIEGDDAHRIGTCDECGGYMRTRFSGEDDRAPLSYEVEDVVMARLDAIANDPSFAGGNPERVGA